MRGPVKWEPQHSMAAAKRPWYFETDCARDALAGRPLLERYLSDHTREGSDLFSASLVYGELISNVVKHVPFGGVRVWLERERGKFALCISDAGNGFTMADMRKPDDSSESGRGLFIVRQVCERVSFHREGRDGFVVRAVLPLDRRRLMRTSQPRRTIIPKEVTRMLQDVCEYGRCVAVDMSPAQAIEAAKAALKEEGFGVLCEIDVAKTLKEKLGVDVPPHVILGACNPKLAHAGLQAEPNLGLLLPCNMTVRESNGATIVGAVDASKMMHVVGNPALEPIAHEANERLGRVLDKLDAMRG